MLPRFPCTPPRPPHDAHARLIETKENEGTVAWPAVGGVPIAGGGGSTGLVAVVVAVRGFSSGPRMHHFIAALALAGEARGKTPDAMRLWSTVCAVTWRLAI